MNSKLIILDFAEGDWYWHASSEKKA